LFNQTVSEMARKKGIHVPDPRERKVLEETARALNEQFKKTFTRVQYDYGEAGKRMAEEVNSALGEEFNAFLFDFYQTATAHLSDFPAGEETIAYPRAVTSTLFVHKWGKGLAVNKPCHIEDILVGNGYIRRFLRELYRDIYAQSQRIMRQQKQES